MAKIIYPISFYFDKLIKNIEEFLFSKGFEKTELEGFDLLYITKTKEYLVGNNSSNLFLAKKNDKSLDLREYIIIEDDLTPKKLKSLLCKLII